MNIHGILSAGCLCALLCAAPSAVSHRPQSPAEPRLVSSLMERSAPSNAAAAVVRQLHQLYLSLEALRRDVTCGYECTVWRVAGDFSYHGDDALLTLDLRLSADAADARKEGSTRHIHVECELDGSFLPAAVCFLSLLLVSCLACQVIAIGVLLYLGRTN